jgi:hypothetical protein
MKRENTMRDYRPARYRPEPYYPVSCTDYTRSSRGWAATSTPLPLPDFTGCDSEECIDEMIGWFVLNFEDTERPAPDDDDLVLILASTHPARPELEAAFGDTCERQLIDAAVEYLEKGDGWIFVQRDKRAPQLRLV